jgi:hypothetical protein
MGESNKKLKHKKGGKGRIKRKKENYIRRQ